MRSLLLFLISMVVAVSPAAGLSLRPVNLSDMVAAADRVFYGRCLSVESGREAATGFPVRRYRFQVLDGLKGVDMGETVVVRHLAGVAGRSAMIPGMVQYRKGQKVLLFLHKDSRLGLTSPVGMSQGLFRERRRTDGERGFVNAQNNRNLIQNLSDSAAREMGVDPGEWQSLRSGEPLRLEVLRELVDTIDRYQQSRGYSIR